MFDLDAMEAADQRLAVLSETPLRPQAQTSARGRSPALECPHVAAPSRCPHLALQGRGAA